MSPQSTNRADIRKKFTTSLIPYLTGVVDRVYDYQVGDFRGRKVVTVVTGSGTDRGDLQSTDDVSFFLEVYNFVLYAEKAVASLDDAESGTDVVITLRDTLPFNVGDLVTIDDGTNVEMAEIVDMVDNISITVDELINSYVKPSVSSWTEAQSEDRLDLLEQLVYNAVVAANDEDGWRYVTLDGRSEPDVVTIGGIPYRFEIIPIKFDVPELPWQS